MAETEITVQVFEDLMTVCNKLENLGFEKTRKFKMSDWYFSKYSDKELSTFGYAKAISSSVLVREVVEETTEKVLCYKAKIIDEEGNVISEEKVATDVEDINKTILLLNLAGLNMWEEVKNKSIIYKKDNIEFALQEIEGLGIFIEMEEFDEMKSLTSEEKFARLKRIVKTFGLVLGKDFSCKKVFMKFKNRLKQTNGTHETLPYEVRAKLVKENKWLMDFLDNKKE